MNDDLMGGGPFVPFDPPQNPQQDAIRRMMAEKLMQLPSNDQLDQMEALQRAFGNHYERSNPRPDGTIGSRSFSEALTPMARNFDRLAPERPVQGPGMADINNAGSVTPEDLNRQRVMAQQVMQNYAPPMRRPMR